MAQSPPDVPLRGYLSAIRHHIGLLVICALVGACVGYGLLAVSGGDWTSTSKVIVRPPVVDPQTTPSSPDQLINMDTEAQVATSGVVRNLVRRDLGGALSDEELKKGVTVTVPPNTQVLSFQFAAGSAGQARQAVDSYADSYLAYSQEESEQTQGNRLDALQQRADTVENEIEQANGQLSQTRANSPQERLLSSRVNTLTNELTTLTAGIAQLQATQPDAGAVIQQSTPAERAARPAVLLLGGGVLLGLAVGMALAVLREQRDRRVLTVDELTTDFAIPVLAEVGATRRDRRTDTDPLEPPASYRHVRDALVAETTPPVTVAVLSLAEPGTGGTAGVHLATTLARTGRSVAIVDADPEDTTVAELLDVGDALGLADALSGRLGKEQSPFVTRGQLTVLPAGSFDRDSADRLTSPAFGTVLAGTKDNDVTVMVVPPVHRVGGQPLLKYAQAVLYVVRPKTTTRSEVAEVGERAERAGLRVLGAVVLHGRPGQQPSPPTAPAVPEQGASAEGSESGVSSPRQPS